MMNELLTIGTGVAFGVATPFVHKGAKKLANKSMAKDVEKYVNKAMSKADEEDLNEEAMFQIIEESTEKAGKKAITKVAIADGLFVAAGAGATIAVANATSNKDDAGDVGTGSPEAAIASAFLI